MEEAVIPMSNDACLTIDITKSYDEFLMQVQLTVNSGEFFSLLGPSGCGKTTLLRLIAGLERPDQGNIRLNGVEISHLTPARRQIGLVFQDYALFPHLNVRDNIAYGLKTRQVSAAETIKRVNELIDLFELEHLAKRPIQQLSGGEQQRVAIARALAPRPEVLLLDEPFSALDYALRRRLRGDLKKYQRLLGITTVFVTHHQEEALAISDRIGLMQEGTMLQVGEPAAVYQNPVNRFVAEFLGEVNLIACTVVEPRDTAYYQIQSGLGKPFTYQTREENLPQGEAVLMIRPEDIQLTDAEEPMFTGTVTDCEYLGPNNRLEIKIGKEILKVLTGKSGARLQPGDRVGINFDPAMLKVISDEF